MLRWRNLPEFPRHLLPIPRRRPPGLLWLGQDLVCPSPTSLYTPPLSSRLHVRPCACRSLKPPSLFHVMLHPSNVA